MQKGYLVFELRKDNGATPVSNAQVKITSIDGREINRLLNVDEDGKTNVFEVYTKDSGLTFDRSNKEIPYTKVNAEVRFENDKIISIEDIQVYSNITSIQEVKFDGRENQNKYMRDKKGKSKKEHIHFKNEMPCIFLEEHKKHKNSHEDKSIKPITKCDKIIIPEFITIHMGEPSECGEILTIPFIDYIKNVSCSCVYPTWREEALRANIYAITSFALNRIYTDWYKSRGYGFEITNSRNYDQMYVRGRTLFRNVCDIVDEIFDSCIKVEGFNQPLLAKCENLSKEERCLSRWGSLDLAEDGLDALEILRKYYGDNIKVEKASYIAGIRRPYSGKPLSFDSVGDDVKFIQRALNFIGKKYTGIDKILQEDGIYGENTEKAVKNFQSIFNLKRDGIVGSKTWNKICLVYSLIKKIFGSDNDIEDSEQDSLPLKLGSRGELVKIIQEDLNYVLSNYNFYKNLKVDGIYGPLTEKAVLDFQKIFSLVPDGIVGKDTLDRLEYVKENLKKLDNVFSNKALINDEKVYGELKGYQDMDSSGECLNNNNFTIINQRKLSKEVNMCINISFGDVGDDVKQLQKELNNLGKLYDFLEPLKEDGIFGENTKRVLEKFQEKFGLPVTGVFDRENLRKLMSIKKALNELKDLRSLLKNGKVLDENNKPEEIEKLITPFKKEFSMKYPNFDINYGTICGYVTLIQKYINEIKKFNTKIFSSFKDLIEDGKFGEKTLKYINEFQEYFNLPKSNKVNHHTWNKLVNEYEKACEK